MRFLVILFLGLILTSCASTEMKPSDYEKEKKAVLKVLTDQEFAWNKGDIDGFMEGYWKSDFLTFVGSSGVTKGWNETKDNFNKAYPTRDRMGTLSFDVNEIHRVQDGLYRIIGKYTLQRDEDAPTGYFTIMLQQDEGKWVIISDHTC